MRELVGRRLVWVVAVMGGAYLALYGTGVWLILREVRLEGESPLVSAGLTSMLMAAGLYVIQFLVVVFAALISVDTLAGEIASGTIQTVATRPVRRRGIIAGKLAGHALATVAFASIMMVSVAAITRLASGIESQGLLPAIALVSLEGLVMLGISYVAGAVTGTLATALVAFMLYSVALVGSWIERIGVLMGNVAAQYVGIVCSLLMPTEALWQRAASGLLPPVLRETAGLVTPFTGANPPSAAIVLYGALYAGVCVLLAARAFDRRDL
jgi:ABC-type transport system involved in multi-copper enzyme maturation permease subunit